MAWLRIRDGIAEKGFLAFDLRDVLRALGPGALGWTWTVPGIGAGGEALEAVGEGLADLEALGRSGERVLGSRLAQIADGVQQVIWGEFRAYREQTATEPFVRVIAFDGSCFEVWSNDNGVIGRVQAAFRDAEPISPPAF